MNMTHIVVTHPYWGEIRIDFNKEDDGLGTIYLWPLQDEEYKTWVQTHCEDIAVLVKHPVGWEEVGVKSFSQASLPA